MTSKDEFYVIRGEFELPTITGWERQITSFAFKEIKKEEAGPNVPECKQKFAETVWNSCMTMLESNFYADKQEDIESLQLYDSKQDLKGI